MRRIVAVLGTLVLAVALVGALATTTASADTKSWSTKKGVVKSVKVVFDRDFVVLTTKARAPERGGYVEGSWLLKTTDASEHYDFKITWSHHEPSFQTEDGTYIYCEGIERAVGLTKVRFGIPIACLVDAEGTEPEWIRSRVRATVDGMTPAGDHVTRHGAFPAGGEFTAPVVREAAR